MDREVTRGNLAVGVAAEVWYCLPSSRQYRLRELSSDEGHNADLDSLIGLTMEVPSITMVPGTLQLAKVSRWSVSAKNEFY
jgi:hypothetical protein